MPLPAMERVPVEVWLRILRFALAPPLSPAPSDSILDYRVVFLTGCDSDHVALAHENDIANCRLVCKSWDTTVKKLQEIAILCDFEKRIRRPRRPSFGTPPEFEYVPSHLCQEPVPEMQPIVTRIEAWTKGSHCHCFRSTCRYKKLSPPGDHPLRDLSAAPGSDKSVSNIKSLLIGMKVDDDYLIGLLDAMPSLTALFCRIRDKPAWRTMFERAPFQRLTHLQVRVSWAPFCRSLSHVALSELVYLGVVFFLPDDDSDYANPPIDNVYWCAQPKLRYLDLEGEVLECRREEFYAFLAVERPNVSGLVLRVRLDEYANSEYLFPPNLSASFPNLTFFGVDAGALLLPSFPPAPNTTSIDFMLCFSTIDKWYRSEMPTADDFFNSIRKVCRGWKPNRIVLSTTWETEAQFIDGFKLVGRTERPRAFYLPHYARFFQVLNEEGIAVVDRNGESTEKTEGRRYVESLETRGFDKYDNGPQLHRAWLDSLPKIPFKPGTKGGTSWPVVDSD